MTLSIDTAIQSFRIDVPQAELDVALRCIAERSYNIVHWSEFAPGGHFAAMEAPDLLVGDIRAFFRRFRASRSSAEKPICRTVKRPNSVQWMA